MSACGALLGADGGLPSGKTLLLKDGFNDEVLDGLLLL